MKSEIKLTIWFPGDVKPVRVGVYQQRDGLGRSVGYQYWNGSSWGAWHVTPEFAYRFRNSPIDEHHQNDQWRGIAGKPQ